MGLILVLAFLFVGTTYLAATDPYTTKGHHMAQDTQLIGQLAPAAEDNAQQHRGWQSGPTGDPTATEDLGQVEMDPAASYFWDRRANRQLMGLDGEIESMADFDPGPSMAERDPDHFTPVVLPEGM